MAMGAKQQGYGLVVGNIQFPSAHYIHYERSAKAYPPPFQVVNLRVWCIPSYLRLNANYSGYIRYVEFGRSHKVYKHTHIVR